MIRIRLDENLSYRIAVALRALGIPSDVKIESPQEEGEKGLDDVSWIEVFAKRGGRCVVSGDGMMRYREPERAALEAGGLIAIFVPVPSFWRPLRKLGQAALILRWYPVIEERARHAPPGTHYRIPPSWLASSDKLRELPRIITKPRNSPPMKIKAKKRKARKGALI